MVSNKLDRLKKELPFSGCAKTEENLGTKRRMLSALYAKIRWPFFVTYC
jgi:hypothetical protein